MDHILHLWLIWRRMPIFNWRHTVYHSMVAFLDCSASYIFSVMFVGISQCSVINSRWNRLLVVFYCTDFLTLTRSPQVVWISNFARFKGTATTIAATAANTPWTYEKNSMNARCVDICIKFGIHAMNEYERCRSVQIGAMVENIYVHISHNGSYNRDRIDTFMYNNVRWYVIC